MYSAGNEDSIILNLDLKAFFFTFVPLYLRRMDS